MEKHSTAQKAQHLSLLKGASCEYSNLLPHQFIEQQAATNPDAIAASHNNQQFSYSALNSRANQLASALKVHGLKQGDRCGVALKPSLGIIVAILAIHKIGAAYLPLDPDAPKQRLEYILADAAPSLTIIQKNQFLSFDLENISTLNYDEIDLSQNTQNNQDLAPTITDTDIANIFYTSGTTGHPKGVLVSYKNYRNYINVAIDRFSMNAKTIMPSIAKFTFSISLFELMAPLAAGGSVRILDRETILTPLALISELQKSTMVHIGPSLWLRLLSAIKTYNIAPASLEHIAHASSGGDLVPAELLEQLTTTFSNAEVFVVYGCSEISCMGTAFLAPTQAHIEKTFVGTPFNNTHVAILNYHTQQPVPLGDKGEICFAGDGVASDYIGHSNNIKKKMVRIGDRDYYRTGDVGRITQDYQVEMLGREDFQVKISGVRIELSEVDYHLRKAPYIEDAISMFWQNESGENRIFAYTTKTLLHEQIQEIRTYLQNHLIEQMQPKSFIHIEALPLNSNLKVDRKALPKPSAENIIREAQFGIATTPSQKKLLTIWQNMIGHNDIGIDDDFFNSGGSSLQGVDLMQRIDREMGIALPLNTLMLNRTIRTLAAAVDNSNQSTQNTLSIELKNTHDSSNIFFIHDGNGEAIPYASLSQHLDTKHSIYGLTPPTSGYAKITETTFNNLSKVYAAEITRIQPKGPIIVGGLCIGGYLAYCVAAELEAQGREIPHIILFDSHYIDATPQPYIKQQRKEQIQELTQQLTDNLINPIAALKTSGALLQKAFNFMRYKTSNIVSKRIKRLQILLLGSSKRFPSLLQCKLPYPDVDSVLRHAEKTFKQRPSALGCVVLFRATTRLKTLDHLNINDTPYSYLFEGDDLGWNKAHRGKISIHDIAAGHSTILTPPYNQEIASILAKELC